MMKIECLSAHPHLIDHIARWHFDEWHSLYPERTLDDFAADLRESLGEHAVPSTWLIFHQGELSGTAAVLQHDMETNRELTPWLANVYIKQDKRGLGLGRKVVHHVMSAHGKQSDEPLFLFTEDQQAFYQSMGWQEIKQECYANKPVSVMQFIPASRTDIVV
ncbi:GNAT family N-acetyltransferase [Plesiomonas shigelloides]|uniref:GNAT family N-acetyltransferase n=1 Tax=Plesiomonas shigelloides TaxID=703 RepID=UPI002246BF0C|nr:GNAT family N-acetyltransferase [Plesiomonas shigelloides]MCX2534749.1 GNAT family N-acetyltransferase [Plesiomonas shigelloides]